VVAVNQWSGNRRGLFEPHVPGIEWGYGAMGCARWKGVRLNDNLVALRRRPIEGNHHQVQIDGEGVHRHDLRGAGPDQFRKRGRERFVIGDPRPPGTVVAPDGELPPVGQFLFDQLRRGGRLQSEGVAAEIDGGVARGRLGTVELPCKRGQGVLRIEAPGLVGAGTEGTRLTQGAGGVSTSPQTPQVRSAASA